MSPAPSERHQWISIELVYALRRFLEDHPCVPYHAPIDVFLPDPAWGSEDTVVQPDILVICDDARIEEDGIHVRRTSSWKFYRRPRGTAT